MCAKFFDEDEDDEKPSKSKKSKGDEIEVAIRVNKKALERTFFIVTILILVGVIIFLMLNKGNCTIEEQPVPVVQEVAQPVAAAQTTTTTIKEENITTTTTPTTTTTVPKKTTLDAEIIFAAEDITLEGECPSALKVKEISYKIKNTGKRFTAKVEVSWYDDDDDDAVITLFKSKIRNDDERFILEQDATATRTIEDFSPRGVSCNGNEEIFIIKLYDAEDDDLIDTDTVNYSQ